MFKIVEYLDWIDHEIQIFGQVIEIVRTSIGKEASVTNMNDNIRKFNKIEILFAITVFIEAIHGQE